ncbi:MAG TPA: GAF domain-containing protein, partial [Anaerolineae bacterium]|nr:GAF domain-containing protein [Anaerolineae bacterium]
MSGRSKPADRRWWRRLLSLGEQLMAQPTVIAQRELIVETAARMVGGRADLWLGEPLRRLPGVETSRLASEPPSDLMRRALDTRRMFPSERAELSTAPAVALPLLAHDTVLGVLEVERGSGPPFNDAEIELLDCLAIQSAVALEAGRRVAIERWRIEQLSLVRKVGAQVTSVLGLGELSRRVANLIFDTFEYYHVAL